MISGKYSRYRNLFYCIYCGICDSIRAMFGRKKENPEDRKPGYGRWVNLEEGGGVNTGLPGAGPERKKEKKSE